jgi:hypothetical protein
VSDTGLTRKDGYRRNRVEVPVGLVVTDRNLVFAAVGGDGSNAGKLAYGELAGVDLEDERLVLTTDEGVNWRFPLSEPESEAVGIAVRHLCWIGEVRNRLLSTENDIELATGKIRSLGDDLDWEAALETYKETRERLDDLICVVQATTPLPDAVLAPELADLDRQLESACARLYIERCRSQLELVTQLIQYEDYEQARKVFEGATDYYDRARWHTEEVKRADAFQFGRQRSLAHNIEEVRWEIESAAAEPLQQAKEATVQAETADTLSTEIESLESALRRYRGLRTLAWDEYLADDPDTVAGDIQETATELIERHERAARDQWNDGSRLETESRLQEAIDACTVATEHLERAHELAEEFDSERAPEFESRLKQMFEMLIDMRNTVDATTARESDETGTDQDGSGEDASLSDIPETGEHRQGDLPTLDDLAGMDLHHDITLDLEGDADPLDLDEEAERVELEEGEDVLDSAGVDEEESGAEDEVESGKHRPSNGTESV